MSSVIITCRRLIGYVIEFINSIPVGDMDNENFPKQDPATGQLLHTDVALKRRLRDYHAEVRGDERGQGVFYMPGRCTETRLREIYEDNKLDPTAKNGDKAKNVLKATQKLIEGFWDIRLCGGMFLGGAFPGDAITGALQIPQMYTPYVPILQENTMVCSGTFKEADAKHQGRGDGDANGTPVAKRWAREAVFFGFANLDGNLARKRGVTEKDFTYLLEAFQNFGENMNTTSKGTVQTRGLVWFEYDSPLGRTPSRLLRERLQVTPKHDKVVCWEDLNVSLDRENLPKDVKLHEVLWS